MTIAALGVVLIGATEEAATVVRLFLGGRTPKGVAAGGARASIRNLTKLVPAMALLEQAAGGTLDMYNYACEVMGGCWAWVTIPVIEESCDPGTREAVLAAERRDRQAGPLISRAWRRRLRPRGFLRSMASTAASESSARQTASRSVCAS